MTGKCSFHPVVAILLPLACMLVAPALALAQVDYCEPAPGIKAELKKVSDVYEENRPYAARLEKQRTMLQDLLSKHPDDFFVKRRYQDSRRADSFADMDPIVADYRAQMEKKPTDPVAVYLYARMLVGRQTKEAIALSEKLTQQTPDFPWTYLQLAEIYNYPSFRDVSKSKDKLKQWIAKCPNEKASFNLVSRLGDKEMMTAAVQRLRTMLGSSSYNDELYYWNNLWSLQFKLKPVPEHEQLRQEIAEDIKKIRAKNLNTTEWLQTLQAGYKQSGDKAGERWAQDEIIRLFPQSDTTKFIIQSRDDDERPYPKPDEPEEKKQAYFRAQLETTAEWLKRWPDDERSWLNRVYALEGLKGSKAEDMEAAYNGYARAHESQGYYLFSPPIEVAVAKFYLQRGFRLEKIPAMLQKALTEMEKREKSSGVSDLFPRSDDFESSLVYTRWQAWPLMAETYARTNQPAKATAVLAEMARALKEKEPGENATDSKKKAYAYNAGIYWEAVAKVAEADKRKLDALTAYQTAMAVRGKSSPDELNKTVQRLWKDLGGTDQGWRAFMARVDSKNKFESAEEATWDTKNTVLPEFDLTDLDGRKWTLADLKGKVAFINLWATWCGPCRRELPYVQKLREQLKDRKDVVILTLNIDDEVGKVAPFMKENNYSFPVLLGQAYAEAQGVGAIPRNWVVTVDGKLAFEGIGFDNNGEEWMKKAAQVIEKAKGAN